MTIKEAWDQENEKHQIVRSYTISLDDLECVLVNDGSFYWICNSEEFFSALDQEISPKMDWYEELCNSVPHNAKLAELYEEITGQEKNWPI